MAAAEGPVTEFSSFANFEDKKGKWNLLMSFPKTGNQIGSFDDIKKKRVIPLLSADSRYFRRIYMKPKPIEEQWKIIVNKVRCRTFTYIERVKEVESLGFLKTSLERMVTSAPRYYKQPAETTNRDIHPNYSSSFETGVNNKAKKLFLEPLHSFMDKNSSVNERAPFPRVYASLVSSLRSNEH